MTEFLTIRLTDRRPIRINKELWPVIAHGGWKDWDNQYDFQANRKWALNIRVRQHNDGRAIVYGDYDYDTHFQHEDGAAAHVGLYLEAGADVAKAIREVGFYLRQRIEAWSNDNATRGKQHIFDCVAECLGELPAEDIDGRVMTAADLES